MSTEADHFGIEQSDLTEIRQWTRFNNRLRRFRIHSTTKTFAEIFGEDQAERLQNHYKNSCHEDIVHFLTYLTRDQTNDFFVYIVKNYKND